MFGDIAKLLENCLNEGCPTYKPIVSALVGTVNILMGSQSAKAQCKEGFYLNS